MATIPDKASLVLSLNRALLGAVSNPMRAVLIRADSDAIYIMAVFDGLIEQEDRSAISLVGTEVAADFPDFQVYEECVRSDVPSLIPNHTGWHMVFEKRPTVTGSE